MIRNVYTAARSITKCTVFPERARSSLPSPLARMDITLPAWLQTTIQGVVSGLHWGLGAGLGAMMGGVLYASLGPRLCFRVSAALPSISLLLLALPTVRRWCSRVRSVSREGNGALYELVEKVSM